ncbi:D-glycero-beta-D-manno-heptose-7-phosphate kinase [bacterium]|nr:D-glycero-beta-D-manno-heptose-7-phosphate kinase [bacterium]
MTNFTQTRIDELFSAIKNKNIAVIGDLMVDRYVWGTIERISPEAPVPVVAVVDETQDLGGAANVVHNLASLGANPLPFGVVGDDINSQILFDKLNYYNLDGSCIFTDQSRQTTVKTRIIAHNQHVVRIDHETQQALSTDIEDKIIDSFKRMGKDLSAVIFQDYNKGVVTERIIREIIGISRRLGIIIAVDPKYRNFFEYKVVTLFKPNIKETEAALVTKITDEADIIRCGREIFNRIEPQHLLITRGSKGMTLFTDRDNIMNLPAKARKIHDVSGAGDTVISTLVAFLTAGANLIEAATIANYAAGAVCEEVGIVPIERNRLREILNDTSVKN